MWFIWSAITFLVNFWHTFLPLPTTFPTPIMFPHPSPSLSLLPPPSPITFPPPTTLSHHFPPFPNPLPSLSPLSLPSPITFPLYTLMLCSTLVLVPLCRYLHAVCTALAFVPPMRSSGYCTFHSPSYSSAPPPLLMLCFSIVYKLLDTPLYSVLILFVSTSALWNLGQLYEQ